MVLNGDSEIRDRIRRSAVIREEQGTSILSFHAMGTRCRISIVEPSRQAANAYLDHCLNWVATFEAKYSRFLNTSLISRINDTAGKQWIETDEETDRILALCNDLVFFTKGAFDPTSLPLIKLWNWKQSPAAIPSQEAINETRKITGWNKIQRKPGAIFLPEPGMALDLGGIGKEYAVDVVTAQAAQFGITSALVDFGQDIKGIGHPPGRPAWHVGLEDPASPGTCWGSVAVQNCAVASSGDYLRYFTQNGRRYGHILDPRTGEPVDNGCLLVNVVAPTCTIAGILSTTAFILGPRDGLDLIQRYHGAGGAISTNNGRQISTHLYEYLVHNS